MASTKGVKLDNETSKRLENIAKIKDRSPHWLMSTAIKQFLDREERYENEKREDMERFERYALSGEAVGHDTASAWLADLSLGKMVPCPK
jgi:predicted transcriptional regulator